MHPRPTVALEWSPRFGYAVGLLTADGNLSPDGRHLEFCSKDFSNVVHLQQCLQLSNKISLKRRGRAPYSTCYRIQFGDVRFCRFLQELGLHPRKSNTLAALRIPREIWPDFLRGYWDGDGGFSTFRHPESYLLQWKVRFTSGSLAFLRWLDDRNDEAYGVTGRMYQTTRAYHLAYHKFSGGQLLKQMYYHPEVICLERKRLSAQRVLLEQAGVAELAQA